MTSRPFWALPLVTGVTVLILVASGCRRPIADTPDAGPDTNDEFVVCADVAECLQLPGATEQNVRCDGVCIFVCNGVDEACPAQNMFCDTNGLCAFGCRDSSRCNQNAGEVCRSGVCTVAAAECTSKCDCDPGELCVDEQCVPATTDTCQGSNQCPRGPKTPTDKCEAYSCNGFTDTCVDLNPQGNLCTTAADCVGRPGCLGGNSCACTQAGACVRDAACTPQTESTACGFGNFCDANNRCQPLPACTQPSDCTGQGLVCNSGTGFCERSQPCVGNTDCTIAPNTICDDGFCTIPTCLNGGQTCTAPLTCNAQGRCSQPGTGVTCTSDAPCQANQFCDLQSQECRVGCRNNAACPSGQICDGNRQCIVDGGGGGGGQFGDDCVDPTECQAPMICGILSGTCAEPCASPADCVACSARSGSECRCNGFGFCAAQ
jgi:hypothetical protein